MRGNLLSVVLKKDRVFSQLLSHLFLTKIFYSARSSGKISLIKTENSTGLHLGHSINHIEPFRANVVYHTYRGGKGNLRTKVHVVQTLRKMTPSALLQSFWVHLKVLLILTYKGTVPPCDWFIGVYIDVNRTA